MWQKFNPKDINNDFELLKSLGINTVRIFFLWEDFQNIKEFYVGPWDQKEPYDKRLSDWKETETLVNPEMVDHFDQVLEIAKKRRLGLIPTLFTAWMSGIFFDPPFRKDRNIFTDPTILRYQTAYCRFFAQRYQNEKQILAWDLANEQNCVLSCPNHDAGWLWTHLLANEIKRWDKNHPVTSGMHGLDNTRAGKSGFALKDLAETLDFLCVHPYPLFQAAECPDRSDNIRTSFLASFQNRLYEGIGKKPVMAEEFGTLGDSFMSEKIGTEYIRMALYRLYGAGSLGALFWCGFNFEHRYEPPYDYHPMEQQLGLFNKDGKPNLIGKEIKKFAEFLSKQKFQCYKRKKGSSAIVVPWREENQPMLFNAFILSKMAQINPEIINVEDAFADYRLLIFPAAGRMVLRIRDWDRLKEWVASGSIAYFSYHDFQFPEQNEFFGIETITRKKTESSLCRCSFSRSDFIPCHSEPLHGVGRGEESQPFFSLRRTEGWRLIVEPKEAKVLAVNESGNPLILENRFGKGKVILATEPLELYLSRMPDTLPENKIYLLYAYLKSLAGLETSKQESNPETEKVDFENGSSLTLNFKQKSAGFVLKKGLKPINTDKDNDF
ncbi:MAG: cellulase family glycosylhydrolase [Candidatus Omnitrophota bacterium]